MGFLDEIKRLARPVDDYDDEYDNDFTSKSTQKASAAEQPETFAQQSVQDKKNKIVNIHATTQLQVVVVEPDKFENAKEIADHLRDKRTVVLNLESTGKDVSRRILDFLSGVAYAQEGKIKKIAVSTYMITPYNVEILGDLMDELENNSQYF